jgi:two-component system, OmpR family, alkaline phosphatase synthesis response regulator PhoP
MAQVLVVEDDRLLSHAYQLILEKDGHNVQVAENGQQALELAKKHEPEIILLDLLMPTMGGIEFLEKYSPTTKHPQTTIVILSNLGDEHEVQKAMSLGAYKYIVKAQATPIQLSMLVNNLIRKNITGKAVTRDK